jgi:hypothetical protein
MLKLRATITPHNCPFVDKEVKVMNKKSVAILGGTITFYVTPQMVVAVKRTVDLKDWTNLNKTYAVSVHEIRTRVEVVLE